MMKLRLLTATLATLTFVSTASYATQQTQCSEAEQTECNLIFPPSGWYLGGQLGLATTDTSDSNLDSLYQQAGIDADSTKVDDNDMAYSLFIGYQFNQYFGLEAGYMDLGERKVDFSGQTLDLEAYYDLAEHVYPETADGLSINLVARYPLTEDFNIAGKLGYFDWEMDAVTTEINGQPHVGDDNRSGGDVWLGAELGYQLNEQSEAYLSYQYIPLQEDDVSVIALGVRYWFGETEKSRKPQKPMKKAKPASVPVAVQRDTDGDGVFDANDNCAATPITHKVDSQGCTIYAPQQAEIDLTVLYQNNSDQIAPAYFEKVKALAEFINQYKVQKVTVTGHTSKAGSAAYNQNLSERRAKSVANMLATEFNIDADIIETVGKGESEPVSDNPNENRRIQVYLKEVLNLPVEK